MNHGYQQDLAYIHDAGFTHTVRDAAPSILGRLRKAGIASGLVVDLGCGSGRLAFDLSAAGYDVLGIDQSPAMIEMARGHAPGARFQAGSFHDLEVPPCVAVTSVGECFNYAFGGEHGLDQLGDLFSRIHAALEPGGMLMFDIMGPERLPAMGSQKSWREGEDWAVLVENTVEEDGRILARHIVSFRRIGEFYRRSEETHHVVLFRPEEVAAELRHAGFEVRISDRYDGAAQPHVGVRIFFATKL